MKVGICDDIKQELIRINEFLIEENICSEDEVQIYLPQEVVEKLDKASFDCDIMIMDIEFEIEDLNGITLSKKINKYLPKCQILYLTSVLEFAPDVYTTEHCYFVLKANMEEMLPLAMEKAVHIYEKLLKQASIEVISDSHRVFIRQEDIYYIEKDNRQTVIHGKCGNFICYQSLKKIGSLLNEDMIRCHGGYIINLNYVKYLGSDEIDMSNGERVPIGRTYKTYVKEQYLNYWMELV